MPEVQAPSQQIAMEALPAGEVVSQQPAVEEPMSSDVSLRGGCGESIDCCGITESCGCC
ncbi:hypothetical protein M406DRAFT_355134 [Cryphonectria parasitica EP155]|uniref:Uncharacterized protein n=1 Tax=Cryphonectria parasitica (strain ATCC 38755 / EP155) TaxID=660469 RepID=A0A9P5CSV9_CRYP1|nr:uncharacterized protein M406DRAFT_355134 [Cryphonectria parasitica EP155]KAF3769037.1 hypothetical protein M406DRAFT_355134 [Cryphonectria parasitica EP155]